MFVKNGYDIVQCMACDTLHVSPIPTDAELKAHYQDSAYFHGQAEQGYRNYADMKKALLPHFRRRLRAINNRFPERGHLLDFGCAAGYFLELARSDGWHIAGVEISPEMTRTASHALGIQVVPSLDALAEDGFHVITLWEVIEHLPRPVEELRHLYDRLRPGGMLMLSTPNTAHWQAIREPEAWVGFRPPSHLLFLTPGTLTVALRRAGFEHIMVRQVSPLPPLPGWLRRISTPLQRGLVSGNARAWPLALTAWRTVRLFGWGWQRLARPQDNIYATLEAQAFRPQ
jgi:2-polyprenyl-3-methyl-5-hydroxy-6-metoxy-1,4-benzoquinol methylase